ncbi:hypothetical protein M0Q50_10800 [bacterium]|jgi:hypothetical protein|nr:hypothetical protein [bacterium]
MYKDNFTKLSGKIQLDNYKSYPMQYFLISNIVYLIEEQKLIEVIGVSLQYIQGNTSIETMIGYENGYKYLPYIGEKLKYKNLAITTFYNSGFSYAFDYKIKQFTTSINYEHDYDFTKKSKTLITIGYKFKYLK